MLRLAGRLKAGAVGVMTVKLVSRHLGQLLDGTRATLPSSFHVLCARSLFHNRREVTLLLRSRR